MMFKSAGYSKRLFGTRCFHNDKIEPAIKSLQPLLESWRKDFHMHPELGLKETRTAATIADLLDTFGSIKVCKAVGITGVVGTLSGTKLSSSSVKSIGLRADMDALPMQEENNFDYKSKTDGVFHGCGHDGHTTMLLGAAKYLAEHTELFAGTVNFIFQPAEENAGGARIMIKDGLFERFPCEEVYGVHNWPYITAGTIDVKSGPIMASADEFDIVIEGSGGHAAFPHLSVDPIVVGSQLVNLLQSIVSRGADPLLASVLSVTKFQSGSAYNVIPQFARLSGTVRTFDEKERERVRAAMDTVLQSTCAAFGATGSLKYIKGYPVTANSVAESQHAKKAAIATVGEDMVTSNAKNTMGAEDFSYMLAQVPGCYAWIGTESQGVLHEPNFDFDDRILTIGVQYFVNIAKQRLN